MKAKYLLLFGLVGLFFSCDNLKQAPEKITDTYYGVLPCADCPGIYYELRLNKDFSYTETRQYLESDAGITRVSGVYEVKPDSIIILAGKSGLGKLKFTQGTLEVLDREGRKITTKLAKHYVLKTQKPELSINANKSSTGIFKATGNEPFWSLKIDSKNDSLTFSFLGEKEIKTILPKAQKIDNNLIYEVSSKARKIHVLISEQKCQDNMSGRWFSHEVTVSYKTSDMKNTEAVRGCGSYYYDIPRELTGDWQLLKLNGKTIEKSGKYNTPTMKLRPNEGKVFGNAGCNIYNGQVEILDNGKLRFSKVISTMMACPVLTIENEFKNALSQPLTVKIEEEKLTLKNNENVLVFVRK